MAALKTAISVRSRVSASAAKRRMSPQQGLPQSLRLHRGLLGRSVRRRSKRAASPLHRRAIACSFARTKISRSAARCMNGYVSCWCRGQHAHDRNLQSVIVFGSEQSGPNGNRERRCGEHGTRLSVRELSARNSDTPHSTGLLDSRRSPESQPRYLRLNLLRYTPFLSGSHGPSGPPRSRLPHSCGGTFLSVLMLMCGQRMSPGG